MDELTKLREENANLKRELELRHTWVKHHQKTVELKLKEIALLKKDYKTIFDLINIFINNHPRLSFIRRKLREIL